MDVNTVYIAAAIALLAVVVYVMRHRRNVGKVLQHNNEVPPLMLQRSTQLKVSRLQEVAQTNTHASKQLQRITDDYKNKKFGIREYNDKLDTMIIRLNIEL